MIIFLETKQRAHSFCSPLVFPSLTNGIGGFDMLLSRLKKQKEKRISLSSNVIAVGTSQFPLGRELCHTLYNQKISAILFQNLAILLLNNIDFA
jgi:hypothetical protein